MQGPHFLLGDFQHFGMRLYLCALGVHSSQPVEWRLWSKCFFRVLCFELSCLTVWALHCLSQSGLYPLNFGGNQCPFYHLINVVLRIRYRVHSKIPCTECCTLGKGNAKMKPNQNHFCHCYPHWRGFCYFLVPVADSVLTGVIHLHLAGFERCTLALQVMGV